MARRPKHDPRESEREILDAAEQLLRERPFREISVDAVMSRTGLKRPAFYVHFRDRHDLVLRVVENLGREVFEMTERWLQGDDPATDARQALEGLVDVYAAHGPVFRAVSDAATTDEKVEDAYRTLMQRFIDATTAHIREEQARGRIGELADVEETARALIWMDERYLSEALGREPAADPQVVVGVLYSIWMSALYNNAPTAATPRNTTLLHAAGHESR
ncbi:TetR/AcrR family transcriptional regulator [Nocardia inohanensis]|uniref:TetR/AcrR family transcriptional regulator n=1 Tax=Nocardia inohanensis TaxID=209246 RepID=UPI00082C9B60|nr:TetR/AcrR family transcriptional regulator [Nocardia inohanensis]